MARVDRYFVVGLTGALLILTAVAVEVPVVSPGSLGYLVAASLTLLTASVATFVGLTATAAGEWTRQARGRGHRRTARRSAPNAKDPREAARVARLVRSGGWR